MAGASGVRIGWTDLPAEVRAAVESVLGAAVVDAVSQSGGFSPGTADRVRTADGRRAFVKAVSTEQNPHSVVMHRREAEITAALPDWAPTAELLGSYDDGTWVALVLQDIEGHHPGTPWQPDELRRVLAVLDEFATRSTTLDLPGLPVAVEGFVADFAGWHRIADDRPANLDPWAAQRLDELRAAADRGRAALTGNALVHADLRADNILVGADGGVTLIDWPWACRGPSWLDTLLLLLNVRLHGGHDMAALLADLVDTHGASRADVLGALAGIAGAFTDAARQPPPPGLPTLRAFQQVQADAALSWLREETVRTGLPG